MVPKASWHVMLPWPPIVRRPPDVKGCVHDPHCCILRISVMYGQHSVGQVDY